MATEGVPVHIKAASDQETAKLVKEHSGPFLNRLNTTQTDSPAISETDKPDIDNDLKAGSGLEASKPTDMKPSPDTKPPVTKSAESPIGSIPVARESQVSGGPMDEKLAGEKRGIDSTVTPAPAPAQDEAQQKPELSGEPDTKKLKTDEKPATELNGTGAAPSKTENAGLKEASRSKKDKIKDAVNKVIPGDGIGSRTRSRTKGA